MAILQNYAKRLIFMKQIIFVFITNFQKEKANTFTLLIIPIVKSLQIELLLYRLYLFRILVQYETILLGPKDLLL